MKRLLLGLVVLCGVAFGQNSVQRFHTALPIAMQLCKMDELSLLVEVDRAIDSLKDHPVNRLDRNSVAEMLVAIKASISDDNASCQGIITSFAVYLDGESINYPLAVIATAQEFGLK